MEAMDIILFAFRYGIFYYVVNLIYWVIGCLALILGLLRLYCWLTAGTCDSDQEMEGKTVLITEGSAGIGKAAAKDLARRKARVILACRNMDKANRVADEIKYSTDNQNVIVKPLHLASFDSIRKCAEDVIRTEKRLDVLINNAAIFTNERERTEDGNDIIMQSNYLGHFLLTLLLLDLLRKSSPSRIINVSSATYITGKMHFSDINGNNDEDPLESFNSSKLANILFTKELAKRLSNSGVTVNVLNPGIVNTDILQADKFVVYLSLFLVLIIGKSSEKGAQTTIYLAVDPEVENKTGKYFMDCKEETLEGKALDTSLATQLFEESERIVGVKFK